MIRKANKSTKLKNIEDINFLVFRNLQSFINSIFMTISIIIDFNLEVLNTDHDLLIGSCILASERKKIYDQLLFA